MSPLLTVVIPIYNEEESLSIFLPEVVNHCNQKGYLLIAVNDGSSDNSSGILEVFESKHSSVKVLTHKVNRGYGGALKTGIKEATTRYVITIDADGQHYLADVDYLLDEMISINADMIVGSRKGQVSASLIRGMGKSIIRFIAKLLMKVPIYDINSGMKIYDTKLAKSYLNLTPDTMAYSDIITLIFINNRRYVLERPIKIKNRLRGKSTIGFRTAFETVLEIINIIILFNPLKIFLPLALFCFLFGLGWGVFIFIQGMGISTGASTLILSGLLIFLLGLIAEQLSSLRKNR